MQVKKKTGFALRFDQEKTYINLKKLAKEKRWSVNTLINSILEENSGVNKKKVDK